MLWNSFKIFHNILLNAARKCPTTVDICLFLRLRHGLTGRGALLRHRQGTLQNSHCVSLPGSTSAQWQCPCQLWPVPLASSSARSTAQCVSCSLRHCQRRSSRCFNVQVWPLRQYICTCTPRKKHALHAKNRGTMPCWHSFESFHLICLRQEEGPSQAKVTCRLVRISVTFNLGL